ncbi:hypothetical protein RUM44_012343 [Polyplax serrata]|uniref:Uncharacterized protein n=1 Tax=Polyplax serrata TaxID=468196 RepID=A0ABR1BB24_POLSC
MHLFCVSLSTYFVFAVGFLIAKTNASSFPADFLYGFATASYQIEGAWNEDGKGENVWDRFVHTKPTRVAGNATGDVACDSYHLYKEDVHMLKELNSNVYRFSLSWSRILPRGDSSYINSPGVDYYKKLINSLLANNIQPVVTLSHWDLPQPLQDLGGWTNPLLVTYFEDYAKVAFEEFGNSVKWWITFNEPLETCTTTYGGDEGAPDLNMPGIADYLCTHTILKSHARAYHLYNDNYRKQQKGKVGIALNGGWNEPLTDSSIDKKAAELAMVFQLGWYLHPILGPNGDYPKVMRETIDRNSESQNYPRSRLPHFSNYWKNQIMGTLDFIGINHYTTYLTASSNDISKFPSFKNDMGVTFSQNKSWPGSAVSWLHVEPIGFRKKLNWLKHYTNNFPILITENGYADFGELEDTKRIEYYKEYIGQLLKSINEDDCNVIGYIAWSLLDNFEWLDGYRPKFGIYKVDFDDPNRTRTAKSSAKFFKNLFKMMHSDEVEHFLNDFVA